MRYAVLAALIVAATVTAVALTLSALVGPRPTFDTPPTTVTDNGAVLIPPASITRENQP